VVGWCAHELFRETPSWVNQVRSEIKAITTTERFSGLSQEGKGISAQWSSAKSPVCEVAYGPHRLDRLAVLGNSVVPTVAAIALKRVLFLEGVKI